MYQASLLHIVAIKDRDHHKINTYNIVISAMIDKGNVGRYDDYHVRQAFTHGIRCILYTTAKFLL